MRSGEDRDGADHLDDNRRRPAGDLVEVLTEARELELGAPVDPPICLAGGGGVIGDPLAPVDRAVPVVRLRALDLGDRRGALEGVGNVLHLGPLSAVRQARLAHDLSAESSDRCAVMIDAATAGWQPAVAPLPPPWSVDVSAMGPITGVVGGHR
jgi:hypothetical protein